MKYSAIKLKEDKIQCFNCKHELTLDETKELANEFNKYKICPSELKYCLCYECLNEANRD